MHNISFLQNVVTEEKTLQKKEPQQKEKKASGKSWWEIFGSDSDKKSEK